MPGTAYPFVVDYLNTLVEESSNTLEIGCGGRQYESLLHGHYSGLDLPDSPYLEKSPDYACRAEEIDCPDKQFDLIFGVATFLIVPDIDRAFSECRRVLRQGGRLVVFDYQAHICRRLKVADPNHKHVWNFRQISSRLVNAGFDPKGIRNLSTLALPISRPYLKSVPRRIAHAMGNKGAWLIVEART